MSPGTSPALVIGLLIPLVSVTSQMYNQSVDLLSELFTGYDRDVRPLLDQSNSLSVYVAMEIRSIEQVNEKDQTIAVRAAFLLSWMDEILTWSPQDYGQLQVINPGVDRTWLPALNLAGQVSDSQALVDTSISTPVRVRHNGSVAWYPNVRLIQTCKMDMTYFPYDQHTCLFEIYTLMYTIDQVELVLSTPSPGQSGFVENGEWEFQSSSWATETYNVHTDIYQVINMNLTIRRRPRFFMLNLLFPTLALSFLNILVFVLPADSGEKVGYSITVLLSVMLIMGVTTDSLPASSQLPLITQFLASLVAISVLSVIATVLSLFVHHQAEDGEKEKAKASFTLRRWKAAVAKKLFRTPATQQVCPAAETTEREARHHHSQTGKGPDLCVTPSNSIHTNSCHTAAQGQLETKGGGDLSMHSVDVGRETYEKPSDQTDCQMDTTASSGFHRLQTSTCTNKSGGAGLSSIWYNKEKSGLRNTSKEEPDASHGTLDTDAVENSSLSVTDVLHVCKIKLDLIFFWVFLITWLAVTVAFSIAIFS